MKINRKIIYLDNGATTKISHEVLEEMMPFLKEEFGNDSSPHKLGRNAKAATDMARERVAKSVGTDSSKIFFTSSGSEANTWAIIGHTKKDFDKKHIIISEVEHSSIMNTALDLEKNFGYKVSRIKVDKNCNIEIDELENAIIKDTSMISIMLANNEIGTIQNVKKIGEICKEKKIKFHTDAVAYYGKGKIDVEEIGCDFLSISAHKVHAPKGVAALYIKNPDKMGKLIFGGSQENSLRGGTANAAYIAGFGRAAEEITKNIEENKNYLTKMRNHMKDRLVKEISDIRINTPMENSVAGVLNVSILGTRSEEMIMLLDNKGVAVSASSACEAGVQKTSHVLTAMGLSEDEIKSALRISFSRENTIEEIDKAVDIIKECTEKLRDFEE